MVAKNGPVDIQLKASNIDFGAVTPCVRMVVAIRENSP